MGNATLEIGKEYVPEGESTLTDQLRDLHLKVHQAKPGPGHRGEHPKQHAGLWATFRVAADVPESDAGGIVRHTAQLHRDRAIFQWPRRRRYQA